MILNHWGDHHTALAPSIFDPRVPQFLTRIVCNWEKCHTHIFFVILSLFVLKCSSAVMSYMSICAYIYLYTLYIVIYVHMILCNVK